MMSVVHDNFAVKPIAVVRNCFREKFGVPRQGGLVQSAVGEIVLLPPFNRREWLDGLEQCTHIWVLFWFHLVDASRSKSSVRPPRIGGNERMGVFATRSMFRPNPIGLSALELCDISETNQELVLKVRGADMVDGIPVIDIKPYVPYCDAIEHARCQWAMQPPQTIGVEFEPAVEEKIRRLGEQRQLPLAAVIVETLAQDPRPAFHREQPQRIYGALLWDWDVQWIYDANALGEIVARVVSIEEQSR